MAIISTGAATAGKADVDANFNLNVVTPQTEIQAGFVQMSSEVDAGTVIGTRTVRSVEVSHDFRVRVATDQPLFNLSFEGAVIATAHLQQTVLTMAAAQVNGFLSLNNTSLTTNATFNTVRTYRCFPLIGSYPTYCDMWIREANATATNTVSEYGFGYAATTATPTDGVFFRRLSGGTLQGVVNFAGAENVVSISTVNVPARDGTGTYDASETNHYLITNHNDDVDFWINDVLVGKVSTPSNQGGPTSSSQQPFFARVYNSGLASAGRRVEIGFLQIAGGDVVTNKPWAQQLAGSGGGSYQTQPGTAVAGTVIRTAATNGWPASGTAKTAGTWTATSAPAEASLGGRFLTPAMSGLVSESDYPVFAYLNPAGTNALPGKTLYVTGINIDSNAVTAAAVAPTSLFWAAGVGSTAAATTTADSVTTSSPKIVPLGIHSYLVTAAAGTPAESIIFDASSPLVVPPGTYFHVICRPVTTVAANTLSVQGIVSINGFFE